ncbi:hypothetical protein WJX81_003942 [Elliptochloris bilobata]|uniref:Uncharacterized protein n=1 Tax=Elliptochloris bilobata TaxID=381761 RepID=A0AAW1R4E9_9CHLO
MQGGGGRRAFRKDYSLLRDGTADVFAPDVEIGKKKSASAWRLLALAKEEALCLVVATLALLVSSLATVAVPKLAGSLIDVCIQYGQEGGRDTAKRHLNNMLYQILGILAIGGVATGIRSWLFNSAAERVMWQLRNRLFQRLVEQEIGFFDRVRTGELMNRLSEDTRLMKSAGTISISIALRSIVVSIFGVVLMFMTSPLLSALTLACLPVLLASFRVYSTLNRKYISEQLTSSAEASTVAEETFGSIRTVRSFAKEKASCERYGVAQHQVLRWGLKSAHASGFFFGFNSLVAMGSIVTVLWFGARQVVDAYLSAGDLSTFIIYALYVGANVGALAGVISNLIQAVGASERVFELLDRIPQLPEPGMMEPMGAPEGGDINLQDVTFAYPSRPDVTVLRGINLHVPPGRKVALVGPSGGGKSTIVNLIQRFYDPRSGGVFLDGCPLPAIQHEFLHKQVSIVSQEPVLFAESILYNIAFGVSNPHSVPLAQVEEAAKLANAHDFIQAFPQAYHTQVGERGVRLSGGQKQRVAIARAILTKPRVLLLDEATSALDAESESLVQEALDRVAVGRTVIVIAHRLSTVQSAAEVAVVDGGVIAERGTHDELLAQGGVYAQLVRRQLQPGVAAMPGDLPGVSPGPFAAAALEAGSPEDQLLASFSDAAAAAGEDRNAVAADAQALMRLLRRQSTRGLVDDLLGDTVGLLGRPTRLPGRVSSARSLRLPASLGGNGGAKGSLAEEQEEQEEQEDESGHGGGGARANGSGLRQ